MIIGRYTKFSGRWIYFHSKKRGNLLIMNDKHLNPNIYICKTDDGKKIYFNKETRMFGSITYSGRIVGVGATVTAGLIGSSFFRRFDHITLIPEHEISGPILAGIIGIFFGFLAGMMHKRLWSKKQLITKEIKIDKESLDKFLALANVELDENKGLLLILFLGAAISGIAFYLDREILLLIGEAALISIGVYYFYVYDFKTRKKLYADLKKMKI